MDYCKVPRSTSEKAKKSFLVGYPPTPLNKGGVGTVNDFFAFSDVLSGRLQKSVYRIKKSSFVLILWMVQISKSQGVPFVLETLKLNNS